MSEQVNLSIGSLKKWLLKSKRPHSSCQSQLRRVVVPCLGRLPTCWLGSSVNKKKSKISKMREDTTIRITINRNQAAAINKEEECLVEETTARWITKAKECAVEETSMTEATITKAALIIREEVSNNAEVVETKEVDVVVEAIEEAT